MAKLNDLAALKALLPSDYAPQQNDAKPNKKPKLSIRLDSKARRGKQITMIEGAFKNEEEIEELAKSLKSHCGVGGSFTETGILLQGDVRSVATKWLEQNGFEVKQKP